MRHPISLVPTATATLPACIAAPADRPRLVP